MADHHHHETVAKKPIEDMWRVYRGPKLSNSEFSKIIRNPFFTMNHLKVMWPWVVSFTLLGYTFLNMFLPHNIDGSQFGPSLYRRQLENRGVFTKENNPYNADRAALWTEARNQLKQERAEGRH